MARFAVRSLRDRSRDAAASPVWAPMCDVMLELHLATTTGLVPDACGAYLHFPDVAAIHTAWRSGGLPVSDVEDKEWGMREFTVADPGGNTIRVGQNI